MRPHNQKPGRRFPHDDDGRQLTPIAGLRWESEGNPGKSDPGKSDSQSDIFI